MLDDFKAHRLRHYGTEHPHHLMQAGEDFFLQPYFDCMEHIAVHLVLEARNGGPMQYR